MFNSIRQNLGFFASKQHLNNKIRANPRNPRIKMPFLANTGCPITPLFEKTNPILSTAGGLQVQLTQEDMIILQFRRPKNKPNSNPKQTQFYDFVECIFKFCDNLRKSVVKITTFLCKTNPIFAPFSPKTHICPKNEPNSNPISTRFCTKMDIWQKTNPKRTQFSTSRDGLWLFVVFCFIVFSTVRTCARRSTNIKDPASRIEYQESNIENRQKL
jgi:hypothetical protein